MQRVVADTTPKPFNVALTEWTVPVYFADATTPRHDVAITAPWTTYRRLSGVPIPPAALPDAQADGHMAVIDGLTGCEYDFWQANRSSSGAWSASWGNTTKITGSGVFDGGLGVRASGFALGAGLIRAEELASGRIDHALVVTSPSVESGGPVAPATKSDGTSNVDGAVPMGARLQLDPAFDVSTLPTSYERTIARALQVYGMFVGDSGGSVGLFAANTNGYQGSGAYAGVLPIQPSIKLDHIPLGRLRVLRLGPKLGPINRLTPSGCPLPTR